MRSSSLPVLSSEKTAAFLTKAQYGFFSLHFEKPWSFSPRFDTGLLFSSPSPHPLFPEALPFLRSLYLTHHQKHSFWRWFSLLPVSWFQTFFSSGVLRSPPPALIYWLNIIFAIALNCIHVRLLYHKRRIGSGAPRHFLSKWWLDGIICRFTA